MENGIQQLTMPKVKKVTAPLLVNTGVILSQRPLLSISFAQVIERFGPSSKELI
jgi:hypothetical protein